MCSLCTSKFKNLQSFKGHVSGQHPRSVSASQVSAFANQSKRHVDCIGTNECPFCDDSWANIESRPDTEDDIVVVNIDQFRRHVGHHMQQVALFALPRLVQNRDASQGSRYVVQSAHRDSVSKTSRWVRDDYGRGWSVLLRKRAMLTVFATLFELYLSVKRISFIISMEGIEPDFNNQRQHFDNLGYFMPPSSHKAYTRNRRSLFRWTDGRVTSATDIHTGPKQDLESTLFCHSQATVFSQQDRTDHLLAVDCDATVVDLPHKNHRWSCLSFNYVSLNDVKSKNTTSDSRTYYSQIDLFGTEGRTAAPISSHLVSQLLPRCYDYMARIDSNGIEIPPTTISAGLTGNLPILIALAAFSAPLRNLRTVLEENLRLNQWIPHSFPTGRR